MEQRCFNGGQIVMMLHECERTRISDNTYLPTLGQPK
jgi:hypothetical protein